VLYVCLFRREKRYVARLMLEEQGRESKVKESIRPAARCRWRPAKSEHMGACHA